MKEANLMRRLMVAASKYATLFRNNQGVATYADGSVVKYGIANPGGSDLIGWRTVTVTPAMVGRRVAVFTAVEVKTERGRLTDAQEHFLEVVHRAGGIAIVARSEADLSRLVPEKPN